MSQQDCYFDSDNEKKLNTLYDEYLKNSEGTSQMDYKIQEELDQMKTTLEDKIATLEEDKSKCLEAAKKLEENIDKLTAEQKILSAEVRRLKDIVEKTNKYTSQVDMCLTDIYGIAKKYQNLKKRKGNDGKPLLSEEVLEDLEE